MFNAVFYRPLYNALALIVDFIPEHDIGLAVVALTILVRLILFPLYQKATKASLVMKKIAPEVELIKKKYPDRQEQTLKMLELYKREKINPFTSIVVLIIQLPIIIALFYVFRGNLSFEPNLLYTFIPLPAVVNLKFLGLVSVTAKNTFLAILTGLAQYIQISITLPPAPAKATGDLKNDLARSMNLQMKYVMPVMITFIAAGLNAAVPLYWITSTVFSIGQDLYVKRKLKILA